MTSKRWDICIFCSALFSVLDYPKKSKRNFFVQSRLKCRRNGPYSCRKLTVEWNRRNTKKSTFLYFLPCVYTSAKNQFNFITVGNFLSLFHQLQGCPLASVCMYLWPMLLVLCMYLYLYLHSYEFVFVFVFVLLSICICICTFK